MDRKLQTELHNFTEQSLKSDLALIQILVTSRRDLQC